MAISLNPEATKKLSLVKQLYQQALNHAVHEQNPIKQALAVIEFDLTIEAALGTVISILEPSSSLDSKNFPSLLKQADTLLKTKVLGNIPDQIQINKVHNIRNDAQHRLKYPNSLTVNDCRTYTRDFLNKVTNLIWGKSFDAISVADLIENDEIKKHLIDAEISFDQKKFIESTKHAGTGFEKSLSWVMPFIVGFDPPIFKGIVIARSSNINDTSLDEGMILSFKKMQNVLLATSLSIDYAALMKYKNIVDSAIVIPGGDVHFPEMNIDILSGQNAEKNAEFVLTFCLESILRIEQIVGSLEKPFGKEDSEIWR